VPIMNDAWFNTLTAIKENSNTTAIITSWWDYGHHFKFIADRPVTFDGAWQNTPMAHWVGKLLLTSNETESIGILRMLDCGGNTAFGLVHKKTNFTPITVDIVSQLVKLDKRAANELLTVKGFDQQQAEAILKATHCNPPEAFLITSNDMISKGGVWAHFGSWDFKRSDLWVNVRNLPKNQAIAYLRENYNYTEDQAREAYTSVLVVNSEADANSWIAPWPSFAGSQSSCEQKNATFIQCGNGVVLMDNQVLVPTQQGMAGVKAAAYINKEGEFVTKTFDNAPADAGVAILPGIEGGLQTVVANRPLQESVFVRLFFGGGHGLSHYKLFKKEREPNGQWIYTWKVDWEGSSVTLNQNFIPHASIEKGAKVELDYIGWIEENGTEVVFDSSIIDWKSQNITPRGGFSAPSRPLVFTYGESAFIPGFDTAIAGLQAGDDKTFVVPPEEAYGTDPAASPLGNKTLHFRVHVQSVN